MSIGRRREEARGDADGQLCAAHVHCCCYMLYAHCPTCRMRSAQTAEHAHIAARQTGNIQAANRARAGASCARTRVCIRRHQLSADRAACIDPQVKIVFITRSPPKTTYVKARV